MATENTGNTSPSSAVGADAMGGPLQSPPAPLQPQAQAQTHSLDIPGKSQQQQQQQQQQPQDDPNSDKNVSPQELTLYVEKLLEQINAKFDGVSGQIFGKMDEMSSRIEELEKSIGELVQGADDDPKTTPPTAKSS
ncbi:Heat shock factor-binding protein 1 [Mortierella sp. AD094]|nr:Heat shock factor-binding protein 1 [Mortierella sp. AD094]